VSVFATGTMWCAYLRSAPRLAREEDEGDEDEDRARWGNRQSRQACQLEVYAKDRRSGLFGIR